MPDYQPWVSWEGRRVTLREATGLDRRVEGSGYPVAFVFLTCGKSASSEGNLGTAFSGYFLLESRQQYVVDDRWVC